MDDLVSRRAAIDAAIEATDSWEGFCNIGRQKRIENYINSLPFAPGMDLISRRAAIDICANVIDLFRGQFGAGVLVAIKESIEELPSAQLATDTNVGTKLGADLAEVGTDAVSRKAVKELAYSQIRSMYCGVALKEQRETMLRIADNVIGLLASVASKQSEIIRCKDCQYWNKGSCECPEHAVNCQDYYVGDMETEAEHFCGYAERREVTECNS